MRYTVCVSAIVSLAFSLFPGSSFGQVGAYKENNVIPIRPGVAVCVSPEKAIELVLKFETATETKPGSLIHVEGCTILTAPTFGSVTFVQESSSPKMRFDVVKLTIWELIEGIIPVPVHTFYTIGKSRLIEVRSGVQI